MTPNADSVTLVTFVIWSEEDDGVGLKINGETVWREANWSYLGQAPLPLGVPVILATEVIE